MVRKALVVGGNSGVGLSLTCELIKLGYSLVYVVGKDDINIDDVDDSLVKEFQDRVVSYKVNFINGDFSIFKSITDIDTLIITIGFGRVALFEDLSEFEVLNLLKVNLFAVVEIIKLYYPFIKNNKPFHTSVIASICGRIVSPFFSVYGAAKGGLRFFIENVNCELDAFGVQNRILEVSPGVIDGTMFNGKKNNLSILEGLSTEILTRMFNQETLFIPKYNEIYKDVIEKYNSCPIEFGKESYRYKVNSGRVSKKPQLIIGFLSGTFDLFHIGHLNLLRRAKEQCDYLIVSVHRSGSWKGKETFIPYNERVMIVSSIKYVDEVVEDYLEDSDAWDIYHYDKLFVGSDYKGTERFNRYELLLNGKAEIVYFPYTKGTSSTQLREALKGGKK